MNYAAFSRIAKCHQVFAVHVYPSSDTPVIPFENSIPEKYKDYAEVFCKREADKLPQHRPYDMKIDLLADQQPPWLPIYNLSELELKTLREYLDEMLAKGFIQPSKSPAGAPILFVKKKDGSLRLCVDYRRLNQISVKNRYPLPLINELLDRLGQSTIFTKLDLRGAYNLVRIHPGDEWKTAFRTRYGHFEYLVMPFGLTNAPATFQHLMNDIFHDLLDHFVVIYLDDILIFSKNPREHTEHVRLVLQRLQENGLYVKLEKCTFDSSSVEFLGFEVSQQGINMNKHKIDAVMQWPTPSTVRELQSFLGFANFYRRFIHQYSATITALTQLLKKDNPFDWTSSCQEAFDTLKKRFTTAPILVHANPAEPYIVEADASDFAIGAVLSQRTPSDKKVHPVAFYSRKLTAAERNYEIYDKELLAIKEAFAEWRHYLAGANHQIRVYSDHKNLEYFLASRQLNRRQSRWSLFFADYDFVITYRPGCKQGKPDALSRRSDLREGDTLSDTNDGDSTPRPLLKSSQLIGLLTQTFEAPDPHQQKLLQQIREATKIDDFAKEIQERISRRPSCSSSPAPLVDNEGNTFQDGLLLNNQGLIYVPDNGSRLMILKSCHDSITAGHFGEKKTIELVSRDFWWPKYRAYIKDYIRTCEICKRAKKPRHRPFGMLQPLPVPTRPWKDISLDLIVELPCSKNFDSILTIVDRLTKMAHLIPCTKSIDAPATAKVFFENIFRLHGIPSTITSDRGSVFASKFWKRLFKLLGTKINLSTAYHPQTDGQTERVNQVIEQYLRCFVNYQQDDWVDLLPTMEFTYNNTIHSSIGHSPFYANYGFHPTFDPQLPNESKVPAAEEHIKNLQDLSELLREEMTKAQQSFKEYADRHRMEAHPSIQVGKRVWLYRGHFESTRPCKKLATRCLGPYLVTEQINPVAFRLKLPKKLKIHDVFHVSQLEPAPECTIPDRVQPPPPPIDIDGEEEFEVCAILDSRRFRKRLQYLVAWEGYSIEDASWENKDYVTNAKELIEEFHQRYPEKPR